MNRGEQRRGAADRMPNLFLLGAPKCGTSTLVAVLDQHPDINASRFKEPQYFATDFRRRIIDTEQEYLKQFKANCEALYRLDGTSTYLYSEKAVQNILNTVYDARFLLVFRDPLKMVPSWHSEMLVDLSEDQANIEDAWASIKLRRQGLNIPTRCPYDRYLFYDEIAKHYQHLQRLLVKVKREAVHIVIFDDLVNDFDRTIEGIWRFLGVSPFQTTRVPTLNSRQVWRSHVVAKLVRTQPMQQLKRRVIGVGRFSRIGRLLFKPAKVEALPPAMAYRIRDTYQHDVRQLETFLDRDLSNWLRVEEVSNI